MSDTESRILDTIPDMGGTDSGTESEAQTHAPEQGGDAGHASAQPTQPSGQGGGTDRAQQQVKRRHDGLVEVPNQENPSARDLVDPVSGKVVARGGIERRVFEEGQRHARENTQLKQQLANATRQLGAVNEATQEAVRLNIAPQDQIVAMRVMADFMRDPVKTLQYLTEEVRSKGYQIPFLEHGMSPGMDMNAMQRMIDNKLAPITQRHQAEQAHAQARAQAEQQLSQFIEENEESRSNLDVLAEMLQAQPSLTLHAAYTKMIRWAHDNGLDWTQSLKQQIASRYNQQTEPPQQTNQRQSKPLPNGRSAGNGAQPVSGSAQFNENSSWADIIRQAMHENGVAIT